MGRRLGLFVSLFVGLTFIALVVFRAAVIQALIEDRLAAGGIRVGALDVTEVGLRETRITGLRLGAADELAARTLRFTYALGDLVQGRIETIAIEGLVLKLDLNGDAPALGSLQPLLEGGNGEAPMLPPTMVLSGGRIEVKTPLGPLAAKVDGEAWSEAPGAIAAVVSFELKGEPGRLEGAFDVTRAPDGTMTGSLVLEDGALSLPGAEIGGLLGETTYGSFPGQPPVIDAEFSAGRIDLPDAAFEEARLTLRTEGRGATLTARMSGADGRWSLALAGTLDDYLAAPEVRLDLTALAAAGAALWPLLALPDPAAGDARARLNASGRLPPLMELGEDGSTLGKWLERATLDGQLVAELVGLAYPGRAEAISGDFRIDGALEGGVMTFRLPRDARLAATGLEPEWLGAIGLPDLVVPLVREGATLALRADGEATGTSLAASGMLRLTMRNGAELEAGSQARLDFGEGFALGKLTLEDLRLAARDLPLPGLHLREAQATGTLAGPLDALAGDLDVSLEVRDFAIEDLRAAKATAALPVSIRLAPNSYSLDLRDSGHVTLATAEYGDTIRLKAPLQASLRAGTASLTRNPAGAIALDHEVTLVADPVALVLARKEGDVVVQVAPGPIAIAGTWSSDAPSRATASLASSTFVLPDWEIAGEGLAGTFDLGEPPDRIRAEFTLGALEHRAAAPLFASLAVTGTLRGDEALAYSVEARAPGGAARLRATGSHDTAAGRGAAEIVLDPLTFDPGGLQPGALAPPLADLRDVGGKLDAKATLAWAPEAMTGAARLSLDDLSFETDAATVRGLDLDLRLDRLFPPASPAGQRLTARRIDPGVALDNIDVRFQVGPGAPTRLAIERGALSVSGGRLVLRDMLVDPAAERQDVPLEVEGLDLAELFDMLNVEGLSGSGRLSGKIPIALVSETVIVEAGRLEADAPGRLRFHSEQAARALAGAGESADLMLRVLQNFHYDELSLAIDKPAETDARLALVLLGRNPDVLGGHPFRFNINLEGDTGELVEALSQAHILSNRMLRRAWRPGQ